MHTAGMIERMLVKEPLSITPDQEAQLLAEPFYQRLHLHMQSFERQLRLKVPLQEEYYVMEILKLKGVEAESPALDAIDQFE